MKSEARVRCGASATGSAFEGVALHDHEPESEIDVAMSFRTGWFRL